MLTTWQDLQFAGAAEKSKWAAVVVCTTPMAVDRVALRVDGLNKVGGMDCVCEGLVKVCRNAAALAVMPLIDDASASS